MQASYCKMLLLELLLAICIASLLVAAVYTTGLMHETKDDNWSQSRQGWN